MRQVKGYSASKKCAAPLPVLLAVAVLSGPGAGAATLKPDTKAAFERYVQLTDQRNQRELNGDGAFLWIDGLPEARRREAYARIAAGEVEIARLETREDGKVIPCPGGMIHHWLGTAFIPGANLKQVLGVLEDYEHHAEYYRPDVERSRVESRDGDHFRVFLRFRRTRVITVVLNTEHDVRYFHDGPTRAHSRSSAIRIAQVEDAGKKDEHEKTPGEDDGFLWGMETWWCMEEKGGGVYVQSEVVSLTRDIPMGLGWMIGPFVTSIPKESLKFTMEATRRAILEKLSPAASQSVELPAKSGRVSSPMSRRRDLARAAFSWKRRLDQRRAAVCSNSRTLETWRSHENCAAVRMALLPRKLMSRGS